MKKQMICTLAAALIVSTTAAFGAVKEGSFSVTPLVGGYVFDGGSYLDPTLVVGLRTGYNFTKYFGVEALYDYATKTDGKNGPLKDISMHRFGGQALLHFFPDSVLVPYLAAGYSGVQFEGNGVTHRSRGAFDYGAGAKFFMTDDIAIRGDVRHIIYNINSQTNNDIEFTLGAYFQFGGTVPAAKAVAPPPEPVKVVAAPAAEPVKVVEAPAPEPPLEVIPAAEPAPNMMKYCVTLDIEFDIDKADIRPQYNDEVAKVGDFMKANPTTTAVIEGHADVVGSDEYNMQISQRRAESVVKYLVANFGIDSSRLTAKGYGKTSPIADNATDAGKQKNRRIDAIIDCALNVKEIVTPPARLCMTLNVEFATDSSEIQSNFFGEVNTVGEYMKKYPTTTAVIEGHTDNVGGNDNNLKLSQQRAENVVKYLVDKFGIDQSRLTAKGYGSSRRIAYNSTPEGRQKNRRINAIIDCVIKK